MHRAGHEPESRLQITLNYLAGITDRPLTLLFIGLRFGKQVGNG